MQDISGAMTSESGKCFLLQADRIAVRSTLAAEVFLQTGNRACRFLTEPETSAWVDEGLATISSEWELVQYFSARSRISLEARDRIASGIELSDRIQTLRLICKAILGRPVTIRANTFLYGLPEYFGEAATDGRTIFLPKIVPSFSLMKMMALHQCMLMDCSRLLANSDRIAGDFARIHQYADKRLVRRLPSIVSEMKRLAEDGIPEEYPHSLPCHIPIDTPWWGIILPDLIHKADTAIDVIQANVDGRYEDLPPELLEMLIARLMSMENPDPAGMGQLLARLIDNMELLSPEAEEDLPDIVQTFSYPEWDANLMDYKPDWCLVRHRLCSEDPNQFVETLLAEQHGLITRIKRQFSRLKPEQFRRFRAQPTGDDLDMEALVETWANHRSGLDMSPNVYLRRDKRVRDVAVLLLVDLSGSTEDKVNDRRIIDIQKEAMVLMAEALNALGDSYSVLGFTSDGRYRIDIRQVKDFTEPWNDRVKNRLGNLEPDGLTRMGTVVRHGTFWLGNHPATTRILMILTDGRPYDLEYGNLDYALSDTRKAIQEAEKKGIHPFIITSDVKSTQYLRHIVSETRSIIVPHVELLPHMLPALYKRLTV